MNEPGWIAFADGAWEIQKQLGVGWADACRRLRVACREEWITTMLAPYENENQLPREFWEAEMLFIGHGTISLFVRQMRIVAQIRPSPRVSLCPTRRLESKRARAIAGGASLWAAIELTPLD